MPPNEVLPPLNALRAFDAVSRLGSIAATSKALNVSASSISQHINRLELYLNVPLFERKSNRLVLTKSGEDYFNGIRPAFDTICQATNQLTKSSEEGPLRVNVIPSLAHGWLLNRLRLFEEQYPTVQLSIDSTSELQQVDLDNVDVAIRYGSGDYDDANSDLVLKDFVAPVCTPSFAKQIREPEDMLSVRRAHTACLNPSVVTKWCEWGKDYFSDEVSSKLDDGTGPIFDDAMVLLSAVRQGRCVGIARYSLAKSYLESGELVAPIGSWTSAKGAYYLLTPKRRAERRDAKRFRRWVKKQITDDIQGPFV